MLFGVGVALRSELFLALRGHGLKLVIVAPALAAILKVVLVRSAATRDQATAILTGNGAPEATPLAANAYGPFVDGLIAGWTLLGMIVVVLGAVTARSFESGAIRLPLTRGVGRGAWVMARAIAVIAQALIGIVSLGLAAWLAAALFYDFGPIVEDGFEIFTAAEVRTEILKGAAAATLPLFAAATFGIMLACCSRGAAVAASVALVATLIFDAFRNTLGDAHRYVYASYLPMLRDQSYLSEAAKVARGFSDYSEEHLFLNFVVPVPEALLFLIIATVVAARRKL